MENAEFWQSMIIDMIKKSDETGVGDSKDRFNTLAEQFALPTEQDLVEEFDGTNHELASKLVFVISLPILKHTQALQLRVSSDIIALRVPFLYKLELGLPI